MASPRALRGLLLDHDVAAVWRNIWTDPDARIALRAVNYGDETVPTGVQSTTLSNPSGAERR